MPAYNCCGPYRYTCFLRVFDSFIFWVASNSKLLFIAQRPVTRLATPPGYRRAFAGVTTIEMLCMHFIFLNFNALLHFAQLVQVSHQAMVIINALETLRRHKGC